MMCRALAAAGNKVEFLLCGNYLPEESSDLPDRNYEYRNLTIDGRLRVSMPWQLAALASVLRGSQKAILVFYSVGLLFIPVALVARMLGMKFVYVQGDRYTLMPGMGRLQVLKMRAINVIDRYLAPRSRLNILTGTARLLEYYETFAPKVPAFLCYPPIDLDTFFCGEHSRSVTDRRATSNYTVAYCGTVGEIEGIRTLLRAFALLRKRRDDVDLVIAGRLGGGDVPRGASTFEQLAGELGLGRSVTFTGLLSLRDVTAVMESADILVMPRTDHLRNRVAAPIKLAEYLAAGRAVVATRVGGLESTFEDGCEILLCEPEDEADLTEKLDELLSDDVKRSAMAAAGQAYAVRNFDYRAWGKRATELIEKSTGRK
jgi:glycosyltransferase involved in cell wall biosynthesis